MKYKFGFTLVELIIYIALVSIFVTGAVNFTWDIVYGREKAVQREFVDIDLRTMQGRIAYEFRSAKDILDITSNRIELESKDGSVTVIEQVGDSIEITKDTTGPYRLSSNLVKVNSVVFTDYSSGAENTKNTRIDIDMEQAFPWPGQNIYQTTSSQSIELNGQFNLARQLLIDFSGATFTGSNRMTNVKLRNVGDQDMLIDRLIVSWTDASPSDRLQEVQIAGGNTEWSGSAKTGTEIDIADYLLPLESSQTPVNHMQFNTNIEGSVVFVTFILSDGSFTTGKILLGDAAGLGSCLQTCLDSGYSSGVCRRSERQCLDNSETYEQSGDLFCTQPPDDTCCCTP